MYRCVYVNIYVNIHLHDTFSLTSRQKARCLRITAAKCSPCRSAAYGQTESAIPPKWRYTLPIKQSDINRAQNWHKLTGKYNPLAEAKLLNWRSSTLRSHTPCTGGLSPNKFSSPLGASNILLGGWSIPHLGGQFSQLLRAKSYLNQN